MRRRGLVGAGSLALFTTLLSAYVVRSPWKKVATAARIANFPTEGVPLLRPARIYWNDRQIPYVDAKTDEDAALLLGMVHAHLRLGQMELVRRIAYGRLSESFGGRTLEYDEFLRAMRFSKNAELLEESLPAETRIWLLRFVAGVNFYREKARKRPFEFSYLGLRESESWTVRDVLTISRLVAADFNWGPILSYLSLSTEKGFGDYWNGFLGLSDHEGHPLSALVAHVTEAGSNSFALRGARTRSGKAMLAGDPHLGISVPGFWLLAGLRSPSYHVVGFSIPSLPVVTIGRNESIAWGGTNMHAWSTDLVDVSGEDPKSWSERKERIKVRFGRDRTVTVVDTKWGPLLNSVTLLKNPKLRGQYALKWVGLTPSDEVSALLRVNRAQNWEEFVGAFDSYSAVGIYYTYADKRGNIGLVPAAELPRRKYERQLVYHPERDPGRWERTERLHRKLSVFNPGPWIVSANQPPTDDRRYDSPFEANYSRFERIGELLRGLPKVGRDEVLAIQKDVVSKSARAFAVAASAAAKDRGAAAPWLDELAAWDGAFAADRAEALVATLLAYHLAREYFEGKVGAPVFARMLSSMRVFDILRGRLAEANPGAASWKRVVGRVDGDLKRYKTFGGYHRIKLSYPLSVVPVLGKKFVFRDMPWPGASDTVMKGSFAVSNRERNVTFGAQSRYVFDFADADANDFMMLGGEDGWIGSENFHDMVDDWLADRWTRIPLRAAAAEKAARHVTELAAPEIR